MARREGKGIMKNDAKTESLMNGETGEKKIALREEKGEFWEKQ